jgi:hypothetical protein
MTTEKVIVRLFSFTFLGRDPNIVFRKLHQSRFVQKRIRENELKFLGGSHA